METGRKKVERKAPLILHGYALSFCLSVIVFNPFALFRSAIWTQPKIACVTLIVLVHVIALWKARQTITVSKHWKRQASAWGIFLALGLISTLSSPFPVRSLFGHSITGDGWLYWFLLAGFTLTNNLILRHYPDLFQWQLRGILIGVTLLALSIYPQLLNWQLDYTIHSGQLWSGTEHILATAVYQNHQPIGFYSHRGYAGFPLALSAVLSVVAIQNSWIPARIALPITIIYAVTLSLARVRGALLAMLFGWMWLIPTILGQKPIRRTLIILTLIGIISFGWTTAERRVGDADLFAPTLFRTTIRNFTSDRVYIWEKSRNYFLKKPLFGWGFSGYSISDATHLCPQNTNLIDLKEHHADCQSDSKAILRIQTQSLKAHNLLLDQLISIGLIGTISYFIVLGCYFLENPNIRYSRTLAITIVYFTYTFTWYDSAQFTHIGWWSISVFSLHRLLVPVHSSPRGK